VNGVVRNCRQLVALAVQQPPLDASGPQHRDGDQWTVANDRSDLASQGAWHGAGRAAQGEPDLGALILTSRQLEVPSGIPATGPPAQCDAVPGQLRAGGVEVRGVQL